MRLALNEEWAVGARIGDGGFGAVFEAENTAGEKAAVKLVPKTPGTEREMLFTDLDGIHNVVPVIDSGEHEDQWVLVMPRAEKSLRDHLQEHGQLPLNEAVAVLSDVAEALADLKDREVVHRDLKPENILLLGGRWCLADFGIARYAEATTAQHTYKGGGSLPYMAPEVWKYQRATGATDIYALGVLAYELLEGARPFTGPAEHDYQEQHLHGTPPPLTTAPPLLAALITECLFRAPQGRPAAGNVLARLGQIPAAPLSGGLAALAQANQGAVARQAEADRRASAHATEADRRMALLEAATASFSFIADALLTALTAAAPSAEVRKGNQGGWTVRIDDAQLTLSGPRETAPEVWRTTSTPAPFDVIASAILSLKVPANYHGYEGRSHSLWYADAQTEDQYQWFETAFMDTPLRPTAKTMEPFALNPHHESRGAVSPGMNMHQVAWPFIPLVIGDLDELISRWAGWLAQAATGQLAHPSTMPERDPQGSWRR
ncbi:serine/threonine-protein kinase [Streptomyces mirabilis]|uniref:Serine/threonine-protein kinase n=1 Tax=Streptomyces mirabilis TaxID=68239 RepID=A0ABU3V611_9ACTN|nr:serine/threonine-protein kinase [Streptomyces mirabilis]MCX5357073.1 serine/threonine protein kinase [Streptomyces mirabilis]MDU9001609.1 serine/threonine-protein kinase [Streptomyces mirabilis]